jgi:ribonuclease HI
MGLRSNSNNYVELQALKVLILFAREKEMTSLQIYGDSLNVVNWTKKLQICNHIILSPLIEDRILNNFDPFSFHHVYIK